MDLYVSQPALEHWNYSVLILEVVLHNSDQSNSRGLSDGVQAEAHNMLRERRYPQPLDPLVQPSTPQSYRSQLQSKVNWHNSNYMTLYKLAIANSIIQLPSFLTAASRDNMPVLLRLLGCIIMPVISAGVPLLGYIAFDTSLFHGTGTEMKENASEKADADPLEQLTFVLAVCYFCYSNIMCALYLLGWVGRVS